MLQVDGMKLCRSLRTDATFAAMPLAQLAPLLGFLCLILDRLAPLRNVLSCSCHRVACGENCGASNQYPRNQPNHYLPLCPNHNRTRLILDDFAVGAVCFVDNCDQRDAEQDSILTDEAIDVFAEKLRTPLQIQWHLTRAEAAQTVRQRTRNQMSLATTHSCVFFSRPSTWFTSDVKWTTT
jgi:hypothetical protein